MDCSNIVLHNIARDCDTSKGGIRRVLVANYEAEAFTISAATSGAPEEVTAIKSGITWYEYALRKNTGSMTSTLNVDAAVGLNYVSTELVLQFAKMDIAKRLQMASLSLGNIMAIVEDCNGNYFVLGAEEPVVATAGSGQTGQNKSDGNFYTITLTDECSTYPYTIAATLVPTPTED